MPGLKIRIREMQTRFVPEFSFRVIALIILQVGIFLTDLFLPFGAAAIIAYIAIVQLTLWLPKSQHTIYAGIASSIFIVLGFFWGRPGESLFLMLLNRGLALMGVWVTAIFVLRYERAVLKIGESERFKVLFRTAGEGLIIANKWGNIVSANPELARMFGYKEQELTGKYLEELIPERFWDRYREFKREFYQNPQVIHIGEAPGLETFYGLRKDGREFPVEVGVGYYKTVDEVLTVIFVADITHRKEAEKQIMESKEWLSNFMDSSPAYISILDHDLRIVDCNRPMLEVFNARTKAEVIGKHLAELYPAIEESASLDKYEMVLKTGERVVFDQEVEHPLFGHKYFNIRVFRAGPGVGSIIEDVTMARQAAKKISESNERLSNFIDSTHAYIMILDEHLNVLDCNKPILKMFNVKMKEEVIGRSLKALAPEMAESGRLELYERVLQTGMREEYEQEINHPLLGHKFFNVRLFKADDGLGSIIEDITEKKLAEEELRRYEAIVSNSSDMMALVNKDFEYLSVNDAYAKAFGMTRSQILGHTKAEMFGQPVFERLIRPHAEKCMNGHTVQFHAWVNFPTGDRRYIDFTYNPYYSSGKKVKGFTVNARDATERKMAEEKLKESEERIARFLDSLPVGVYILDANLKPYYANTQSRKILGRGVDPKATLEELRELYPTYISGTDERYPAERSKQNIARILAGETIVSEDSEVEIEGKRIPLHSTASPVFGPDGRVRFIVIVFEDISERKKAEQQLLESEERYRNLFENAADLIQSVDPEGNIRYVNQAWKDTLGYTDDDLKTRKIFGIIHPDSLDRYRKLVERLMAGETVKNMEMEFLTKDGRKIHTEGSMSLGLKGNTVIAVRGIFTDVTDSMIAEKQRNETFRHLQAITETSQDAIISAGEDGNIRYFNPAAEELFGYRSEEINGKSLTTLMPERYTERHLAGFARYKQTGEAHIIGKGPVELHGKKKNGTEFPIELTLASWTTEEGRFFTAIIRDITKRKHMEEKLEENRIPLP